MSRLSFFLLLLIASSYSTMAQNVVFTAAASASKMGQQDQVQVTYTIRDAQGIQSIIPADGGDFIRVGGPFTSQSTNMSIVGNQMVQSSSVSFTYIMQPKKTGSLTIPAGIARDAAGHTYQSNSIPVQVVPGSVGGGQRQQQSSDPFSDPFADPFAMMQQRRMQQQRAMQQQQRGNQQQAQQSDNTPVDVSKDIFIRVAADKNKVKVGEQITINYKLYARIPMQMSISKLPSLNGFWTQDFEIPKNAKPAEEVVNGKKYQVFLLKKSALFPQQTGTLELDAAEAEGTARIIQKVRQRDPFFDNFFNDPAFQAFGSLMMNDPLFNGGFFNSLSYKDVPVHIKSNPFKIQVMPLPDKGKPDNYGGAVGKFTVNAKLSKTDITTDDAINLIVNITGSGNLKLIEAPKLNLPNGLDAYDPVVLDTITGRTTTISGTKIITYALSPRAPGDYTIPAIPFTYFNPESGNYVTLNTEPMKVHVTKGKNYKPGTVKNAPSLTEIHNISTTPISNITTNDKPMIYGSGYWTMCLLPLLSFIGFVVWKRREEEEGKDTVLLRSKRANKIALKRLTSAQKLLEEKKEQPFYEEVSKAIWLYLSNKLNIPLSALSRETAQEALIARKVPHDVQNQLAHIISECETALYAPMGGSQQMNTTYEQAISLISKLEGTFNV